MLILYVDRPLGHIITYRDEQHRLEGSVNIPLDEIVEEALLIREQYCGTVTSTGSTSIRFDRLRGDEGPSSGVQAQQQQQQQQANRINQQIDN
mmetsp:Transcript_20516/g.22725  ORF Transcript_20516/g.22725 Transcript_20516/m.22725 type:complete len:93 (-) Transcript_20516:163-441(-)